MGEFLKNQFQSISKKMLVDFESVQEINHAGIRGKLREIFLEKFLRKYIPKRFSLHNGQIINGEDQSSSETDIIVYDEWSSPILFTEGDIVVVPVETVYATVEVKSVLTINEIVKTVKAVSKLKSISGSFKSSSNRSECFRPNIASILFAYKSKVSIETLEKMLGNIFEKEGITIENQLNAIYVFNEGILSRNSSDGVLPFTMIPKNSPRWEFLPENFGEGGGYDAWNGLLWMYWDLIDFLNKEVKDRPLPSYDTYWGDE